MNTLQDRIRGSLVGGAIGDALGYPVEFLSRKNILHKYGNRGISRLQDFDRNGKAEVSDDTQMTLFTANVLLFGITRLCTHGVLGARMKDFVRYAYMDWLQTQNGIEDYNIYHYCWILDIVELNVKRDPGNTCMSALRAIKNHEEVRNDSKGCGGVMRVAPVGLMAAADEQVKHLTRNMATIRWGQEHPEKINTPELMSRYKSIESMNYDVWLKEKIKYCLDNLFRKKIYLTRGLQTLLSLHKGHNNQKLRSCARHESGYEKMRPQVMKKIAMAVVVAVTALASANEVKAQYYLDYGPGSIAWEYQMQQRENAIRMQNAMMQQQILNYYQQQAAAATWHMQNSPFVPMQGVQTYNGPYINNGESYHTETVNCDHCDGGYNYKQTYMGGGETRTIKSRCNWCHGTGTIKKKVKD